MTVIQGTIRKKFHQCFHLKLCFTLKKSVLKIQEYIHEGANLKFYIPEFFNFKLLIPEYSPIYRFWFQTAAYFFLQCSFLAQRH
jgi:hypothetical protein